MNKPTVVLKNVQTFRGHDGQGLNADIWINGIKCMSFHDDAYGGGGEYHNYTYNNPKAEQVKANIKLLEDYLKTLPEKDYGDFKCKYDMDMFVDELFNEIEKAKHQKKLVKLMQTSFLFGKPNANGYSYIQYKQPLASLPKPYLESELAKYMQKYCKDGVVLLNTNIKELGLVV